MSQISRNVNGDKEVLVPCETGKNSDNLFFN